MTLDSSYYILVKHRRMSIILLIVQMILSLKPALVYIYVPGTTLLFIGLFLTILAYSLSPNSFNYTNKSMAIAILFILAAFIATRGNMYAYTGTALRCLPFLLFIGATNQYKCALLRLFNKWFWWIIAISLFFWILFLLGVPLPHNTLTKADSIYVFDNYYVFVKGAYREIFFPRFCSIFLEPGYVACFIAFMLFADKYNFRNKQNIVYLIALIFTFSVAGWLLFLAGLVPYVSQRGKRKWAYWLFLSAIITAYIYASRASDSVLSTMIGERLRFENGEMVGYNRANMELVDYWDNYFWKSGNVLMGMGESNYTLFEFGASVDLRAYIIKYGLLSALFYIIFMLACLSQNRSRYGLWFFIIVFAFVYRGYSIMFYDATLFVYLAVITLMRLEKEENYKKYLHND